MSKRTITEADRQEAIYTWLSAAQVARRYFADAEDGGTAVSASTIIRWHDDPDHPIKGVDWSRADSGKRLILFRPEAIEAAIQKRIEDAA